MGDNEDFEVHEAFRDAGQKLGMEIWRIEVSGSSVGCTGEWYDDVED